MVFMVVKMLMVVFWVMTSCCIIGGYQCFWANYFHPKTEATDSSETPVTAYQARWCHNQEDWSTLLSIQMSHCTQT